MNKRTISCLDFSRIPAGLLLLVEIVTTVSAAGNLAAIPSLTIPDAPPAGHSPALSFHPRDISRNETMINGG